MKLLLSFLILLTAVCRSEVTNAEVVFEGLPSIKVTVFDNGKPKQETMNPSRSSEYAVRIVKVGNKYLWDSRESKPLNMIKSGAYTTYFAEDGSGYIRIADEGVGAITGEVHRYMEQVTLRLNNITYHGFEVEAK